jgi:hypothetical protein
MAAVAYFTFIGAVISELLCKTDHVLLLGYLSSILFVRKERIGYVRRKI